MFYRRKILLALLQSFGGRLEKIQLQKLLMLYTQLQDAPSFHFVPYKYGCFSFQANADMVTMSKYNQVAGEDECWLLKDASDYSAALKSKDREILKAIKIVYEGRSAEELIYLTYTKYPYYAINSTISSRVLSGREMVAVDKVRPAGNTTVLYTIGYEGISLEEYLNKLICNNIKVLCDVRSKPMSMKYGFSKYQLMNACEGVGIKYLHFPEVGIASEQRQVLKSQDDYNKLFSGVYSNILKEADTTLDRLLILLKDNKRIALTCFEADINQCHRKHLADAITRLKGWQYELKHI